MERMKSGRIVRKGAYLLPNLLTTFNLLCGILAIVLSLEYIAKQTQRPVHHPYMIAAWLILAAMIFDFLDGKVARWVHAVSDFGVKIDSLTDFVSFGIAPLVLVYSVMLQHIPLYFQVIPCGLFLFAGGWRLARFNCESNCNTHQGFFTGLPIPAAASFMCSMVLVFTGNEKVVSKLLGRSFSALPPDVAGVMTAIIMIALAFLMVSRIPFPAFKTVNKRNLILLSGLGIFFAVLLLVLPMQNIVFLVMLLYLLFGLFQYFVERVLKLQTQSKEESA